MSAVLRAARPLWNGRAVYRHWSHAITDDDRLRRLRFRAWHRGTKEADLIVGGFADRYAATWNDGETAWFEALLDEQDGDVVAWAMGAAEVPERLAGPMMEAMKRLDYVVVGK